MIVAATWVFKQKVKVSYQKVRAQIARLNAFLQERISGMSVVQIFNAEGQERDKFRTINREYTKANLDAILYYAVFFPVVEIIAAIALGIDLLGNFDAWVWCVLYSKQRILRN